MLLSKASIGRKLLFSFLVMALLVLLSTAIGVSGFSFVAKTERNVVDTAIPSMLEAREVSELSSRIIASVQVLSNAKTKPQHQEAGRVLFSRLESLLMHINLLAQIHSTPNYSIALNKPFNLLSIVSQTREFCRANHHARPVNITVNDSAKSTSGRARAANAYSSSQHEYDCCC
ncbi:sensor protein torS [Vibrio maritimus]|uniref:Sensor protein torS n=1 Tax=Vibrio maritimus TaxID=990268 RepID=A0A090TRW5_9VIBR|nr:sensor protein torS [Vibrio maritimus]